MHRIVPLNGCTRGLLKESGLCIAIVPTAIEIVAYYYSVLFFLFVIYIFIDCLP